jgi:ribosomal protein S27AE
MTTPARRRHSGDEEKLIIHEVDPASVIDQAEAGNKEALQLLSFGAMREACPKCTDVHLRLVLRQAKVHAEHLLCPQCGACFDAHFADGRSAFSI